MPRPEPGGADEEARLAGERLEETYRSYLASPRKQRSWAADNRGNVAIRAELLRQVLALAEPRLRDGGDVLDIGCGSGWLLRALSGAGVAESRLHGVDLQASRIAAAAEPLPGTGVRVADARALPFEDNSISLVTMLTCLSSMPDDNAIAMALRQARRVCVEDGLVLVYEPWVPNPFNRATRRVGGSLLTANLGAPVTRGRLTGFPPLARRLGGLTQRAYPALASIAPTHRLTAHEPASSPKRP